VTVDSRWDAEVQIREYAVSQRQAACRDRELLQVTAKHAAISAEILAGHWTDLYS
jgi:hypothetical protein